MRDSTKAEWENILNTIAGLDGCIRLVRLKNALESLDNVADDKDDTQHEYAVKLLDVMMRFSKLIDALAPGRLT